MKEDTSILRHHIGNSANSLFYLLFRYLPQPLLSTVISTVRS
jgi:hypothetical protein